MEKFFFIFTTLVHNYGFMLYFWLFITMPVAMFHFGCFNGKKELQEKELVEISPKFEELNLRYIGFSVLWLICFMTWPLISLAPKIDNWAILNYGIRFYPLSVIWTAGYGIYQGLFALISGVYPMDRVLSFAYDDIFRIRRIALFQISISIAVLASAVLFFFATAR